LRWSEALEVPVRSISCRGPETDGRASAGTTQAAGKGDNMNMLTKWNPMQTTRWNPFRELADFERGLESFFGRTPAIAGNGEESITEQLWAPLTDITEDEKEFLVKVELPEMKKEDVKVTVENGTLRITGERKAEKEEKTKKYHRIERSYGAFERAFTLPDGADGNKVSADYKDGVLTVRLPKSAAAKPKAIEVKVA
jgi:HSP20 family protein